MLRLSGMMWYLSVFVTGHFSYILEDLYCILHVIEFPL